MNLHRLKTLVPLWGVFAIATGGFLYGTSPDSIGPVGISAFFIVAYLFLALTIQTGVLGATRLLARPGKIARWRLSYSLIAAFVPVAAIGLDSLDQLVLRDLLIFVALVALLIFYVSRRGSADHKK